MYDNFVSQTVFINFDSPNSLVQLLEDKPLAALQPTLEKMISNKDQNAQRAAAELLAGVIGGERLTGIHPSITYGSQGPSTGHGRNNRNFGIGFAQSSHRSLDKISRLILS